MGWHKDDLKLIYENEVNRGMAGKLKDISDSLSKFCHPNLDHDWWCGCDDCHAKRDRHKEKME